MVLQLLFIMCNAYPGVDLKICRPYPKKKKKITSDKRPHIKIFSQYYAIIFSFK